MSFIEGVVLILSPYKIEEALDKLYKVIYELDMKKIKNKEYFKREYKKIPIEKKYDPFEVQNRKYEWVDLSLANNRVSMDNIIIYPPGIPAIFAGEIINKKVIELLHKNIKDKREILGIKGNTLRLLIESDV